VRILLIGMKGCGKTTLGRLLAAQAGALFIDSDSAIEEMHRRERGEDLSFRQIYRSYGEAYFRFLDARTVRYIAREFGGTDFVFACGGRTPLLEENQEILCGLGKIVYLQVDKAVLLQRILSQGVPAFFPYADDPQKSLDELLAQRLPIYTRLAHQTIDVSAGLSEEAIHAILAE
jgi:shikimate kinase